MDSATIYASRTLSRDPLNDTIINIISKLKISFKPPFRKAHFQKKREPETENWRQNVLGDMVRKVREKDDADYDEVSSHINKLTKQTFIKLMSEILQKMEKRDAMFRLRITTLLFDRGLRQIFFAGMMADAYAEIAKTYPDSLQDLLALVSMFDSLYDASKVIVVPHSTAPGYDEAILEWTKQKEMKRGFAVYVSELYTRKLIPAEIMIGFVNNVFVELRQSVLVPKTGANEEHVDALVRFVFAVAPKITVRENIRTVLTIPKTETLSLNMKSRFKLEDAAKAALN